jgi:predicted O-methyltransferase YrrM
MAAGLIEIALSKLVLSVCTPTQLAWLDIKLGRHQTFYPWGGPMNGQTARLEIVRQLITSLRPVHIIETGTYRATTTAWFAEFGVPVTTIELNPRYAEFARRRLQKRDNVRVLQGDSVAMLHRLATEGTLAEGPVLIYLDAHWGEHLPLREELELLFARCAECIIVIDDFKIDDDDGYIYDEYGYEKTLEVSYLERSKIPGAQAFVPATPGRDETGARRGAIFLTASQKLAALMQRMKELRQITLSGLEQLDRVS